MMDQNRRLDLRNVLLSRGTSVKGHRSRYIGSQPHCQGIGDAASVAETSYADLARAVGTRFQPHRTCHEIFGHLFAIDLAEQLAALVIVAGIRTMTALM